ncbi:MAG: hydrogenase expression/formation protein HypE [Acidobacteriota bacterium]|nr:hydrogenase expression/formation protein HypE [Acidobacteriota bacterium]
MSAPPLARNARRDIRSAPPWSQAKVLVQPTITTAASFPQKASPMPDFSNWSCPLPLRDFPNVVMGHGGGGRLSSELIENIFVPAFSNATLTQLADSSVLDRPTGRIAMSTDSFVVRPLFFPGGCIGDLAVNGTVNDLAMSGARPLYLSAGFILEEGLPLSHLAQIVDSMAKAANAAGVTIVTGDTKVVERGHGDGCYINTSGVGIVPDGLSVAPSLVRPGDKIIVSGSIGDHGMAILSLREGLTFETTIRSDCAALHTLVESALAAAASNAIRAMRDPTRGGLAATLHEIAGASDVGIEIDESSLPVRGEVRSACELLGLDPLFVANEGKMIAFVAPEHADAVLAAMRRHPLGAEAVIIGRAVEEHPRSLVAKTAIGALRVVAPPLGEQLPRIC